MGIAFCDTHFGEIHPNTLLMGKDLIQMVPEELIITKIYVIRGQKVMIDRDLAELYGIETRRLKEQVKRNILRFPADFMFELTIEEMDNWRSQPGTSNREKMGLRIQPFAFTEHGVLMLASILKSERAALVNIWIVRVFVKMRMLLATHKDIIAALKKIEFRISEHDDKILLLLDYIKQFEIQKQKEKKVKDRPRIGFKRQNEKE
jgi:hypothetical protein